jgi:hypothetical protein
MRYGKNAVGVVCAVLLSACASNEPPSINGEFVAINAAPPMDTNSYTLTQVSQPQTIESTTPTTEPTEPQISNVQSQATNDELFLDSGTASISEVVTPQPLQDFFIYPDETYLSAINRWFKSDDVQSIAWAVNDDTQAILSTSPAKMERFSGSNIDALNTLSKSLNIPLIFSHDSYRQLAAIHQWQGREVQIVMVRGSSMKVAIEQLASDYGWNWSDDTTTNKSWLAKNDYPFSGSYPLVTPKNDIAKALRVVLEGYPISAKLLTGTQSLFIVDTQ